MNTKSNKIFIQSTDFKTSRKLSAFIRRQASKLEVFTDRIIEIKVSLKLDRSDASNKICEISVLVPGKDLFVSKRSDTFEESVSISVDALKHQLEAWKATLSGRSRDFKESIKSQNRG